MKDPGLSPRSHRRIQRQGSWSAEWSPRKHSITGIKEERLQKKKMVNIRSFLASQSIPFLVSFRACNFTAPTCPQPGLTEHRWNEGLSLLGWVLLGSYLNSQLKKQVGSGETGGRWGSQSWTWEGRRKGYNFLKMRGRAPDLLCFRSYVGHLTMLLNSHTK